MNLLSLSLDSTVKVLAIIAIGLALIIGVMISISRKLDTRKVVYTALMIALSLALTFIKVTPVAYGGPITLASLVPIIIIGYALGFGYGVFAGVVFGLLFFLLEPWVLTYATFFFDYVFAYAVVGAAGAFRRIIKNKYVNVTLGILLVYFLSFISHFIAGLIYFKHGSVIEGIPNGNAVAYSLVYQLLYLPADALIAIITACALIKGKVFGILIKKVNPDIDTENDISLIKKFKNIDWNKNVKSPIAYTIIFVAAVISIVLLLVYCA